MAVTQSLLVFLGVLAAASAFASMFMNLDDRLMNAALALFSAILWGVFGFSSYSVVVGDGAVIATIEITMFVYLGVGLAFIMFMWTLYEILARLGQETRATNAELT